jgi:hypothetical protein
MDLLTQLPRIILAVLLVFALASPPLATATTAMQIQASVNPTPTNLGISVLILGRIFELYNVSISNAVISIQVNNPQGTSIHVAVAYTDIDGAFRDTFLLPQNSPGGNYTAFLGAEKPGYTTAHIALTFAYLSPDFTVQSSISAMSLQQGQSSSFTITILSIRGFNQRVNLTAIDLPAGVTLQFNPSSVIPSGTTTVDVTSSDNVKVGNFTVTILAVSGEVSHRSTFQLSVRLGPPRINFMLLAGSGSALIFLAVLGLLFRSRRRSRGVAVEELVKQASADSGYVATARVIARLEELRALGQVDEKTYQGLKKEYEKRLQKSS